MSMKDQEQRFFKNLRHLNECRSNLGNKCKELKRKEPLLEQIELPSPPPAQYTSSSKNNMMVRPQQQRLEDGTPVKGLKCLYDTARHAEPIFSQLMNQMATNVGNNQMSGGVNDIMSDVNDINNDPELAGGSCPTPQILSSSRLKEQSRTLARVHRIKDHGRSSDGGTLGHVYDVVRCNILCYASFQIAACLEWLQHDHDQIEIVHAENRFVHPTFCNYGDVIVYIKVKMNMSMNISSETTSSLSFTHHYHVCEVRFHHWELFELQQSMIGLKSAYLYFRDHFAAAIGELSAADHHHQERNTTAIVEQHIADMNSLVVVQDGDNEDDSSSLSLNYKRLDSIVMDCNGDNNDDGDVSRLLALASLLEEKLGNNHRTIQLLQQALRVQEAKVDHNNTASASDDDDDDALLTACILKNLGRVLSKQGLKRTALSSHDKAYKLLCFSSSFGPYHPATLIALEHKAQALVAMGNEEEARQQYLKILLAKQRKAAAVGNNSNDHPDFAMILLKIAHILTAQGKYNEAIAMCEPAMAIFQKYYEADDNLIVDTLRQMGRAYYEDGSKLHKALWNYKAALDITERRHGIQHERYADISKELAMVQVELNLDYKARKSLETALAIYRIIYNTTTAADYKEQQQQHPKIQSTERQLRRLDYARNSMGRPKVGLLPHQKKQQVIGRHCPPAKARRVPSTSYFS
mmetsp:Transcript_1317/g.2618  ORF Transcript_1317/g.2618 Transcript_1317/m.2618 type:complete len:692 (+) Transcript_1317:343-2418(+)